MMRVKYVALVLLSFVFLFFTSFTIKSSKPLQKQVLRKIVIDAGHGGADFGAKGVYSKEKDITLAIALKLEAMLHEEMPDVEIYMTRTTDVYDPVIRKAKLANEAKGDLFVCIHVNEGGGAIQHKEFIGYKQVTVKPKKGSGKQPYTKQVKEYRTWTTPNTAKGTETFIYGVDKSSDAKKALSQHEDMYLDSISARELKDFNPTDPAKMMVINMKTQVYFNRSANLALTIEQEFEKVGRVSRDAKQRQKGIWVLQAVAMPAVLVETGFISNPDEEDYLNSEAGQRETCEVLVRSLKRYRYSLEKQLMNTGTPATQK